MTKIVNLNQFRKARNKVEKQTLPAYNRVRYGRCEDGCRLDKIAKEQYTRGVDG